MIETEKLSDDRQEQAVSDLLDRSGPLTSHVITNRVGFLCHEALERLVHSGKVCVDVGLDGRRNRYTTLVKTKNEIKELEQRIKFLNERLTELKRSLPKSK